MANRIVTVPSLNRASTWRRHPDLISASASGLVLLALVFAAPEELAPLRAIVGLVFVLLVPGYALTAALFPRHVDLEHAESLALSFGLSVAVLPVLALGLRFTPWGIAPLPMLGGLTVITAAAATVAMARREALGPEAATEARARFDVDLRIVAALVLVVGSVGTAVRVLEPPSQATEFSLSGARGELEAYSRDLVAGEDHEVAVAVTNLEARREWFRVHASIGDGPPVVTELPALEHGETWRGTVGVSSPDRVGVDTVELALHRPADVEPYRLLRLRITVADGPPGGSAPDRAGAR